MDAASGNLEDDSIERSHQLFHQLFAKPFVLPRHSYQDNEEEQERCVHGSECGQEPEAHTTHTSDELALPVTLHRCTFFLLHAFQDGVEEGLRP